MKALLSISLSVIVFACVLFAAGSPKQDAIHVSIIRLIASPKEFDGMIVRVEGFMHLQFEGDAIYLHKEDYDRTLTKNGLWLGATGAMRNEMLKMNDCYVLIEGEFSSGDHGHMGLWSGAILDVSRSARESQRQAEVR
jgi:hypothetical protein